ncbi:MAG: leucine-rich repeat protein [Alistipes sp.]|nr:leucine-rich repeat protein [Alistipes sp.]
MKKLFYLFIACMFVGCTTDIDLNNTPMTGNKAKVFTVSLDAASTRTYVDEELHLYWTKGDMLSIFSSTLNEKYLFDGNTGDNSATFSKVNTGFGAGNPLPRNYAVYPHMSSTKISNDGVLAVELPTKQNYADGSFGVGANVMVAATADTDDCFLSMKSVSGFLKLCLYGEGVVVKKIRLEGNAQEKIAGAATVEIGYESDPVVTMGADAKSVITLNCGDGIALGGANDVKEFWICVPPTIFNEGFTVTVVDSNNMAFKQVSNKRQEIVRNTIMRMPEVKVVPTEPDTYVEDEEIVTTEQPNNEIWYTTADGRFIVPDCNPDNFGANAIDFAYENGKGVIRFDGDVTHIGINDARDEDSSGVFSKSNLTSISLPASVTMIGSNAFMECEQLEKVVLREGLISIQSRAFSWSNKLSDITIPSTVTYLGYYSLAGTAIESVVIPHGVRNIITGTFESCEYLQSVTLHDNIVSLGDFAFSGTAISSLDIPDSVLSIGRALFSYCDNLKGLILSSNIKYIPENAFECCYGLTEVNIPNGVTSIDGYAFYGCENLTTVTIPDSVTKIGSGIFENCSSLQSVTLPNGITEIPQEMFAYTGLTTFTIPESVTKIGAGAFNGAHLTEIVIPDSVTEISSKRYYDGSDYDEGYEVVPAFGSCYNLQKITIGKGLKEIPMLMCRDCSALTEVVIGENVTTIGAGAFANTNITEIVIPDSVTEILSEYSYGYEYTEKRSAFASCYELRKLVIGNGLTHIPDGLCKNCYSLGRLSIGNNIRTIGAESFADCSKLTGVVIPENVAQIGERAFDGCYQLDTVYCKPTVPPMGSDDMFESDKSCYFYVPEESVESYKSAPYWSDYAERIVSNKDVEEPVGNNGSEESGSR